VIYIWHILGTVDSFRYVGATVGLCKSGECSTEIRLRFGMTRSTIKSLECFWKSRSLSLEIKKRLLEAVVWPVAMYGCESWTLKAADRRRLAAFEMTAYRKISASARREHRTNMSVRVQVDPKRDLMREVRRQKLKYFGHIVRAQNLATSILHGRVGGLRGRGRPGRRWMDDIKDWTGLSRERQQWREMVWSSSMISVSELQQ